METRLLRLDPGSVTVRDLKSAGEIIRTGGLVVFPTETVYGLGGNALDAWTAVTNLVQEQTLEDRPGLERKGGLIYYRVFLTRPDEELGQETFGRLDNMNFRVALDGTIMGSETDKGWRNPKEDRERWQK